MRICNEIKQGFTNKKSTGLVLLDVEKAFDSVWHNGIIYKLIQFKFPQYLVKIIQQFISNRSYAVFLSQAFSAQFDIPAGVPQGSVLGPLLYNIYTADFPTQITSQFALYADDIAIFQTSSSCDIVVNSLQESLLTINDYLSLWKIKLNSTKTQAIFFTKKRKKVYLPDKNLVIDSATVEWKEKVTYLGIILDKKLLFVPHIHNIRKKYNIAIRLLYPLINRKSLLLTRNKMILCKVVFQAIALYACPIWKSCAKTHLKSLQISQNKLLKLMLNLPWDFSTKKLHHVANIELIVDRINKLNTKFIESCKNSRNKYIKKYF